MKILIVVGGLSSIYGGTSRIVIDWAKVLSQQGLNIDIVATSANGNHKLPVNLNTWITEPEGYRIRYFSFFPIGDYKPSLDLDRWLWQNVVSYDLVHTVACFSLPVLSAYRACQHHKIPYIINPQGTLDKWALQHKAWKKKIYLDWIEKPCLKQAACLHTLTQQETQSYTITYSTL